MLENKLHDIPYILLLRSDRILEDLLENESLNNSHSLDDAIQDFYPNKFRKESLNQAYHPNCRNSSKLNSLDYSFDCLDNLYDDYFTQNGSNIYAKKDKLDRYSSIINKIHPFNIVGYKLAKKLKKEEIDLHTIEQIASTISPLVLDVDKTKRYSDNHIHLYGARETINDVWSLITKDLNNTDRNRISAFSTMNNGRFTLLMLIDILIIIVNTINNFIFDSSKDSYSEERCLIQTILNHHSTYMRQSVNLIYIQKSNKKDILGNANIQKIFSLILTMNEENKIKEEWFLYNLLLHYIHNDKETNGEIKNFIKIFFHIHNIIRSYQVMGEGIGLQSFQDSFSLINHLSSKVSNVEILSNIMNNGTTTFETKISPSELIKQEEIKKNKFSTIVSKSMKDDIFLKICEKNRFHFSLHFTRDRGKNAKKNLKKGSTRIHNFLYEDKYVPTGNIDYRKLIRSIDIAGNENDAPPEQFAPIINYLRYEPKITKENLLGQNIIPHKKLRLSIHAGEDFNHIVTGMRKVDETIYYYSMESKDRLGHALAVGLEPMQWLEANGDIIMTKEELLDNFVWLKRKAEEVSGVYPKAQNLIYRYDKYIQTLSFQIYGNDISTTADELYEAWKLRRNDYQLFSREKADYTTDIYSKSATPDKNISSITDKVKKIFELARNNSNNIVRKNGAEIVYVQYEHFSENHSYLKITDEDLELYRIVQDYMLNMIASKDIFIEACPTSNIYISHLSKYEDHPIFRWHPIDKNVRKNSSFRNSIVKVCVNTDDPAIMPTNLPTEFEHLRLAGKKLGYDSYSIDTWLEELREFGNEIFDDNHEDIELIQ